MAIRNLDARLSTHSSTVISVFRVIVGLLFAMHGTMTLFDWPIPPRMPVEVFDWPNWWAGLIELVTGLLVAAGFFTRIAALIASGEMAVAYFWKHWPPLEGPSASFWPIANNGETAVLYCFSFLLLAFIGGGLYSVDSRRRGGRMAATGAAPPARRRMLGRRDDDVRTDAPVRRRGLLDRFRR